MVIEVKESHIRKGVPKSGTRCMIALALKDAGVEFGWCCPDGLYFDRAMSMEHEKLFTFPPVVQDKMLLFDGGERPEPFDFDYTPLAIKRG
jgi:hypothetical protein